MPTDRPDLAKLADAVEAAHEHQWRFPGGADDSAEVCALSAAVGSWLAALRAARDSGYVEALVSREAVEALREEQRLSERCAEGDGTNDDLYEARDCASHRACDLLARDLAGLLKETT